MIQRIRNLLGPLWWYTALMLGVSQIGNLVSFCIGAFLVPDVIGKEQLGALPAVMQLAGFVACPLSIVIGTGLKYVSLFQAKGEHGRVKQLLRDMMVAAVVLSFLVAFSVWQSRGGIQDRLHFRSNGVVWMVAGVGVISCWLPLVQMAAQGLFRFYPLIMSSVVAPVVRLAAILLFLREFQVAGYMAATLISTASIVLFLGWSVRHSLAPRIAAESYGAYRPEMFRYLLLLGAGVLVANLQGAVEPWVIRQRLSAHDSAGSYIVWLFGNIPAYVAPVMGSFLFPLVSAKHTTGSSTQRMHWQSLGVVLAIGVVLVLMFALGSGRLLDLRASWRTYADFAPYVWQVALVTSISAFIGIHMTHENACGRFTYLWYYVPVVLLEVGLLYGLMGWEFFRPHLPADMWAWVNGFIRRDLQFVLLFMIGSRVALFVAVLAQVWMRREAAEPSATRLGV
jgi:hypothetical protein